MPVKRKGWLRSTMALLCLRTRGIAESRPNSWRAFCGGKAAVGGFERDRRSGRGREGEGEGGYAFVFRGAGVVTRGARKAGAEMCSFQVTRDTQSHPRLSERSRCGLVSAGLSVCHAPPPLSLPLPLPFPLSPPFSPSPSLACSLPSPLSRAFVHVTLGSYPLGLTVRTKLRG